MLSTQAKCWVLHNNCYANHTWLPHRPSLVAVMPRDFMPRRTAVLTTFFPRPLEHGDVERLLRNERAQLPSLSSSRFFSCASLTVIPSYFDRQRINVCAVTPILRAKSARVAPASTSWMASMICFSEEVAVAMRGQQGQAVTRQRPRRQNASNP